MIKIMKTRRKQMLSGALFMSVILSFSSRLYLCAPKAKCFEERKVYVYDQTGSLVVGKLFERTVFGPPGYGESPSTDPTLAIVVLKLLCPTDVNPEPGAKGPRTSNLSHLKGITEIQLFLHREEQKAFAKENLGRVVTVAGKLEEGVSGGEYTKVTMTVGRISRSVTR
jgi:hypothetical protein